MIFTAKEHLIVHLSLKLHVANVQVVKVLQRMCSIFRGVNNTHCRFILQEAFLR